MKRFFRILIFVPLICFSQQIKNESQKVDSLKKIIYSAKHDSVRINAMVSWDNLIYVSNPKADLRLNTTIDSLCEFNIKKKLSFKEHRFFLLRKGSAVNNIGSYHYYKGELKLAEKYYVIGLKTFQLLNHKKGIANAYNNLSNVYSDKGDYATAIKNLLSALRIHEEMNDKEAMASPLNNLGVLYADQKDFTNAIKYYRRSLKVKIEEKDVQGQASTYGNLALAYKDIAALYFSNGQIKLSSIYNDTALQYHAYCLRLFKQVNDKHGISAAYLNTGTVYKEMKNYVIAQKYYDSSLVLHQSLNDNKGIAISKINIGEIYLLQNKITEAKNLFIEGIVLAKEMGELTEIRNGSNFLWSIYKNEGNNKAALEMYELYISSRDTINSQNNQKEIIRQQFKYQYEKQSAADSVKIAEEKKVTDAELLKQKAELKAKRNQQIALYGGLALVFIFAVFIFNRFRITSRQKDIIERQKEVVDEKNKEITDSINYAKRIQSAILPPVKKIKHFFSESFVLYHPKDIVAGDFYWMFNSENTVMIAACDCTGHGVPGAMVSVVCNNGLNRAVREFGLFDPGKILDKTRELVIAEFEKSEEEVKDGMDIALLVFNFNTFSCKDEILKIKFSGANNPLWIVKRTTLTSENSEKFNEKHEVDKNLNGLSKKLSAKKEIANTQNSNLFELFEVKANKQPIGKFAQSKPFITQEIEVKKGDTIYVFTDGYADQFGGEKNKKFKTSRLKEIILGFQNKTMEEQKLILERELRIWQGKNEQNDDVCVIGLKV